MDKLVQLFRYRYKMSPEMAAAQARYFLMHPTDQLGQQYWREAGETEKLWSAVAAGEREAPVDPRQRDTSGAFGRTNWINDNPHTKDEYDDDARMFGYLEPPRLNLPQSKAAPSYPLEALIPYSNKVSR